jgi:hypothetical protein
MFDERICESNHGPICPAKYIISDGELQQGGVFTTYPSTLKACHENAGPYSGNQLVYISPTMESDHMKTDTCSCMQFNGMHLVFVLENIKV